MTLNLTVAWCMLEYMLFTLIAERANMSSLTSFSHLIFGLVLAVLSGYFIGSIPFSLLISKVFGIGDLKSLGSRNIGATNVMRNSNVYIGSLALLLDISKGIFAVVLSSYLAITTPFALEAGIAAVIGHIFPVWLNFSGGKGVATLLGVFVASSMPLAFVFVGSWLVVFNLFGYSSMASITAIVSACITAFVVSNFLWAAKVMVISCLVLYKHKDNLMRFLNGEEKQLRIFNKSTAHNNGRST